MLAVRGIGLTRRAHDLLPVAFASRTSLWESSLGRGVTQARYAATLTLPTEESEIPPRTAADDSEIPSGSSVGHLYFDSVFPLALGSFDPRAYLPFFQGDAALQSLKTALPDAQSIGFDFHYLGTESRAKDGGAFLTFAYKPDASAAQVNTSAILRRIPSSSSLSKDEASTLTVINSRIRPHLKPIHQFSLSPSRLLPASMLSPPRAHIVLGTPWLEDLARFPSRTIKMSFYEGSTPTEQQVWEMLRPYGRVTKLEIDSKTNQATAVYARMRGATSARNCLYGASIGGRKVVIDYLAPMHTHKIWDWLSNHPRIVFPIVAFLLGSLSYAIFDPIRGWFIKSNVENTFDLEAYPLYAWLRKKTVGLFSRKGDESDGSLQDEWWERKAAADEIQSWLRESPTTFITISGPRGSGKHQLIQRAIKNTDIKHLSIDCEEIARSSKNTEAALMPAVAKQVGFFPVVNWINSLNQLIDLASVGLIGSKAGFSTPTDAQLKQVLSVTSAALVSIKEDTLKEKERKRKRSGKGASDSSTKMNHSVSSPTPALTILQPDQDSSKSMGEKATRDELGADIRLLPMDHQGAEEKAFDTPVVIVDGFHHKGVKSDLLWTVLGDWAAELTSGNIAHVVFVSDNPVGMNKTLSRSLPNVPFETIVLADADEDRARGYVYAKLKEMGKAEKPSEVAAQDTASSGNNQSSMAALFGGGISKQDEGMEQERIASKGRLDRDTAKWVDLLGGRLTDLENLVQKVSLGQTVENAVKDIISRTVVEIRKNTFGDDMEDSKSLPWSRGQAWLVVEQLAEKQELPYYATLHDSFKGDETALKALEQAEIISVRHLDSRPSSIRAGRPVIQQAIQSLVADRVFADMQRFLSNTSAIDSCEKVIREVETEIRQLAEGINNGATILKGSQHQAAKDRFDYLLEKLSTNQDKIRMLENKNAVLKQSLSQKEDNH